jgi:tetratricopeptide (TPR) repeat protein/tRNA A-37 threonylcarbamoyl transferase component Bud32
MTQFEPLPNLTADEARQIDRICDRFEAAWKRGERPDPADFLGAAARPTRSALLRQLLLLDVEYARRVGETPQPGDYQTRLPHDSLLIADVCCDVGEKRPGPGKRYELAEEIGRGGIGVVYRARDCVLGRDLAVKVLREENRDSPDAHRRFAAEARVGSQLQHPAIVPVYETGYFADGRPYLAMKLVEGQTLAALLRRRAEPTQDRARLLGIFEQVCQAVAYAHARGVVHRDLKPANVMVGAFGEVQVMDWGFAKVLDGGTGPSADEAVRAEVMGASQSGALMGTPAYMPPEQARGEAALVDPRADVFALGAILCEILTDSPPYGDGPADDVRARAATGDLSGARVRLVKCGADPSLTGLAIRCLASDRVDRPNDAGGVARDMTAYLASAQERLRRAEVERTAAEARANVERRARRLMMGLSAAILLAAGVAGWQAVVATRAKHYAVKAAAAETTAKEEARAKEAKTQSAFDFLEDRIIGAARPKGQDGGLGSAVTLREVLTAALAALDTSFPNQPLAEARVRRAVGLSFLRLGDAKLAAEQYERALALYREHLGPEHIETLKLMDDLGNSYNALGRYPDAARTHESSLVVLTTKYGPDHPETLATMSNLGTTYINLGRYPQALEILQEVLARRTAKLGPDDPRVVASMNKLVVAYVHNDRHQEALELCEKSVERHKAVFGPTNVETLWAMNNLANCYHAAKRYADAAKLREETLRLLKAELPPDHPQLFWGMHNLANSYGKLGRLADALELHRETLALRETKLGPNHPDTLRSLWAIADNLVKLDRGGEAIPVIDDCVRRATGQAVHPELLPAVTKLRMRHFAKIHDAAGCRATAEMWDKLGRADADSLFLSAQYWAVTSKVGRAAVESAAADKVGDPDADRAMESLKKAVAAGFKKVDRVTKHLDLDPLRDRPDFRKLLTELN